MQWSKSFIFPIGAIISSTNLDAANILWSRAFGLRILSCPFPQYMQEEITMLGFIGTILEDIPQIIIQIIYISRENGSFVIYIAMAGIATSVVGGIFMLATLGTMVRTFIKHPIYRYSMIGIIILIIILIIALMASIKKGDTEKSTFEGIGIIFLLMLLSLSGTVSWIFTGMDIINHIEGKK